MATQSANCRLLRLPAELRNQIYELVFADDKISTSVPLDAATPPAGPPKALSLVNRQLYNETRAMSRAAHQKCWTTSTLTLTTGDKSHASSIIDAIAPDDLQHIRSITLKKPTLNEAWLGLGFDYGCEMLDNRGLWRFNYAMGPHMSSYRCRVFRKVDGVVQLSFGADEEMSKFSDKVEELPSVKDQMNSVFAEMWKDG
ncbi:uncharacterized protein CLAFUR5_04253 [Fulvia fulva]|uniref:Uncharacterized protein n=1 Tax=Passalora fulva TaxID=5499 RepID=A0A9Q8LEJ6_PASFU|nr:uncharacterized protein CLAFUR5_04253 [Fulvia fulva]KAK4627689.1 hypothetical protein CLAFUR0_04276 [Fulvia fulva]UJO16040.1 hypothetical protein CLAFUR5_04253 [Fulvia fulva]WPV28317.1 hypothetical protein CLAFUW7_04277 [Fulvia fulva]